VVQKLLLARGDIDDVAAISAAISVWSFVQGRILLERKLHVEEGDCDSEREWAGIDALVSRMVDLPELERKIKASLNDTGTGLESLPKTTEEDPITPQDTSTEDRWQQGYRWSINPE
jgi:hypothetical protein